MAEFSVLGKSVLRVDALEKVTGAARYCADIMLKEPGMLHARVLRSPFPHAYILNMDISKARSAPGVVAVVAGDTGLDRRLAG